MWSIFPHFIVFSFFAQSTLIFRLQRDFCIVHNHVLVFFLFLWIVLLSFTSLSCSLSLFSWYSPLNVKSSCEKNEYRLIFGFLNWGRPLISIFQRVHVAHPWGNIIRRHFLLMSEINLKSKYVSNKMLYKNNSHLHKILQQNRSFLNSFGFNYVFFHLQRFFSIVRYHVLVFFSFFG